MTTAQNLSPAQIAALQFLADGGEQVKVRQARVLLPAGLIATTNDLDRCAAAGGWVIATITDKGREVLAPKPTWIVLLRNHQSGVERTVEVQAANRTAIRFVCPRATGEDIVSATPRG